MSTAHAVLGLLAAGARHGYDLKREHDARLPMVKPLAFGQVYATLVRLLRDGLIEEMAHERVGGPDRTAYALTERGRAELEGWLSTVEPPAPHINSALFLKVVLAVLVSGEVAARQFLTAQRHAHGARLRELTAVKTQPGVRLADVLSVDYAIAHLSADLRWIDNTLARVAELRAEVQG
jgi:DNA-binding PadR family transcriptional regulator